jgi:flavin reductase (DIM6/NTAB) family NADH-FMN oxidoreductase RutF
MPYSSSDEFCRCLVLDEQAKKTLLRKIPHGLYISVRDGEEVNGFTASWVMQASFTSAPGGQLRQSRTPPPTPWSRLAVPLP